MSRALESKSSSLADNERNDYSEYAREFRRALLSHKDSGHSHDRAKEYLRRVFNDLDVNGDGIVSTSELREFVTSVHAEHDDSRVAGNSEKFADVLVSQIDLNHDGLISYKEMYEFLWPKVESDREVGVILDLMRAYFEGCIRGTTISRALHKSSDTNDRMLIDAFAKHINMKILRGNLIEVRALKHALHNLSGLGVGQLSDYEVDILIESLDTNRDGVVSPREFRAWMFIPPSHMTGDMSTTSNADTADHHAAATATPRLTSPGNSPIPSTSNATAYASGLPPPAVTAPSASTTTTHSSASSISHTDDVVSMVDSGQTRRRAPAASAAGRLPKSAVSKTVDRSLFDTERGGDGDSGRDRPSSISEASRLLSSDDGEGMTAQLPAEGTCGRHWGLVLIATVFVVSFYVIATKDD